MHIVISLMLCKVHYFVRENRVVASRLWTQISLKMLLFLTHLSVFADGFAIFVDVRRISLIVVDVRRFSSMLVGFLPLYFL